MNASAPTRLPQRAAAPIAFQGVGLEGFGIGRVEAGEARRRQPVSHRLAACPRRLQAGIIERPFDCFDQHLEASGYIARGGQIVDATIVQVPRHRNTREENETNPRGVEEETGQEPAEDKDARWPKKHGRSFYGYKNHVNADAKYKLIRRYDVSDAAVHDSQKLDGLLNEANTSADVFADGAYRSAETEAGLMVGELIWRSGRRQRGS